jgi:hypothetical protein
MKAEAISNVVGATQLIRMLLLIRELAIIRAQFAACGH